MRGGRGSGRKLPQGRAGLPISTVWFVAMVATVCMGESANALMICASSPVVMNTKDRRAMRSGLHTAAMAREGMTERGTAPGYTTCSYCREYGCR